MMAAGFGVGAAAVFGVLGAQSADAAPAPPSPPSSPANIAKQDAQDKRTAQRSKVNSSADDQKQDAQDKRSAADAGKPARKEERANGSAKGKDSGKSKGDDKSKGKGKGDGKDPRVDGRVSSDDGPRNANNGVKRPEKSKVYGPPAKPRATEVPILDKKSSDLFNRVVRQTLPGVLPRLPNNAGGGGVAVSDQVGDARRTKVVAVPRLPNNAGGGGVAVSDQLGAGRRAAEDVARKARLADTAKRNKSIDDAHTADQAARNKKRAKLEAKLRDDPTGSKAKAAAAAKRNADRVAFEKRKKEEERPVKSVGICGNLSATAGIVAAGAGGCVVVDSKGFGLTGSLRGGAEVGAGGHAGVGIQVSSADIDELEGNSVNVGGSVVPGVGIEGSGGLSADGKDNYTYYGGVAFGAEGSGGGNLEHTRTVRLLPQPKVSVMAPGSPPVDAPS